MITGGERPMLGFRPSPWPIDRRLVDRDLLSADERANWTPITQVRG